MLPTSAIVFLCLLFGIALILGIVNLVIGKSIFPACCCRSCRKGKKEDLEDSDNFGENESLLRMEEGKIRNGKKTDKVGMYGTLTSNSRTSVFEVIDDSGVEDGDSINSDETRATEGQDFEVGPVYSKQFVRAYQAKKITRKTSTPMTKRQRDTERRESSGGDGSVKSLFADASSLHALDPNHSSNTSSTENLYSTTFNGIDSVAVELLVTYDTESKTLTSAVKQLNVTRHESVKVNTKHKSNSNSKLFWQVVIELVEQRQQSIEVLKNQRVKTEYKTGDKITFQSHLDTQNTDLLDNLFIRYSVYARRGTRVSQKQLFGQTSILLMELKQHGDVLSSTRVIRSQGISTLDFDNEERLI